MGTGWGGPLAGVMVLWVFVALACVPLLAISHIRDAVAEWPTENLVGNYLLVTAVAVGGHGALFLASIVLTGGFGGLELIRWTIGAAVGYPVALWAGVGAVATATGQWDSVSEELDRWLWLGFAAIWYAIVTAVAAAFVFFVLFVAFFPG